MSTGIINVQYNDALNNSVAPGLLKIAKTKVTTYKQTKTAIPIIAPALFIKVTSLFLKFNKSII